MKLSSKRTFHHFKLYLTGQAKDGVNDVICNLSVSSSVLFTPLMQLQVDDNELQEVWPTQGVDVRSHQEEDGARKVLWTQKNWVAAQSLLTKRI